MLATLTHAALGYEIPESVLPYPAPSAWSSLDYSFTFATDPFTFTVTRKADDRVLFSSSPLFVYEDQYIELTTSRDLGCAAGA